jgi:hypothetical protein
VRRLPGYGDGLGDVLIGVRIFKQKIPKGMSFPLKTSALEAAVNTAGTLTPVDIHYSNYKTDGPFFRASFYLHGHIIAKESNILSVTCYSVQSGKRCVFQDYLEIVAIPELTNWLVWLEALPANSTLWNDQANLRREWQMPDER